MGKYQPFNDLPAAQFSGLVDDIAKRGVLLPILVDEDDKTIDGHQRRKAAAEAGVDCPKVVVEGLSEDEKQTLAITLNLFRRHLAGVERTKALQQLANLGMSTRRMADVLGLSKSTVHRDIGELSQMGQLDRPERVEGADGKSRPATMPERTPPPDVDPETGEVLSPTGDTEAPSGSDQSDPTSDAAGPGDDDAEQETSDPSPAPKVAPPPVDPILGYRATATAARSKVRDSLLTLDPARVIRTADEHDHWREFSKDVRAWLDALDADLEGPRLKAVQ